MFRTIKMRIENHIHIRHILLYHFEKGHKAAEAFRDLNELFGDGTINESTVRIWFRRFKSGNTSLEDETIFHWRMKQFKKLEQFLYKKQK